MVTADARVERTTTLMFTDVAASTSLATSLGDDHARDLLAAHRTTIRNVLREHGGREIDATGDAFLVAFDSARRSIRCALDIHDALSDPDPGNRGVRVRIGINSGDVLVSDTGISGAAISGAARIVARASVGEVLAAGVVQQLAGRMPGVTFGSRGLHDLRGFSEPVEIVEVRRGGTLTIAVAEDNLLVREGVLAVLGLYRDVKVVATAGDLDTMKCLIETTPPDVVVTDIRMPPTGVDEGLRLAEWLHLTHPGTAVVALSQHADNGYVRRLLASGPSGRAFLLKESISAGDTLHDAIRAVAAGETVIDPVIAAAAMARGELT